MTRLITSQAYQPLWRSRFQMTMTGERRLEDDIVPEETETVRTMFRLYTSICRLPARMVPGCVVEFDRHRDPVESIQNAVWLSKAECVRIISESDKKLCVVTSDQQPQNNCLIVDKSNIDR
jgi:hypothetical protein